MTVGSGSGAAREGHASGCRGPGVARRVSRVSAKLSKPVHGMTCARNFSHTVANNTASPPGPPTKLQSESQSNAPIH